MIGVWSIKWIDRIELVLKSAVMCSRFETASYARGRDRNRSREYLELLRTQTEMEQVILGPCSTIHLQLPQSRRQYFQLAAVFGHCSASNANAHRFQLVHDLLVR